MNNSGWIASPNPEMTIWDSSQLIAMGILVTVLMNILTEAMKSGNKDTERMDRATFQELLSAEGVDRQGSVGAGFEERRSDAYPMAGRHDTGANYGWSQLQQGY